MQHVREMSLPEQQSDFLQNNIYLAYRSTIQKLYLTDGSSTRQPTSKTAYLND